MLKLPYGLADFQAIRNDGYVYVDRTAYLGEIETLGRALVFLRPRRFGKSLWLDTLRCYYDLRLAGEHDRLFGGLAVGREPTPLAHRFFVMRWNFSEIGKSGSATEIGHRLNDYLNNKIDIFLRGYADHLPAMTLKHDATDSLRQVLAAVSSTPYRLYLLIDEYDNFINEVMVSDADTYRALVRAEGPVKTVFKSIKSAMEGQGLERVFLTGVSPVALNDLSSGFNIARDVSRHPHLAALCGFTETELRSEFLEPMLRAGCLVPEPAEKILAVMHDWYNGYRFSGDANGLMLNPTNCLYLLQEIQEVGRYPEQLFDRNLAIDETKLAFLSRSEPGARLVTQLSESEEPIEILGLESQISLEDLLTRVAEDRRFVASLLYYLGLLTLADTPQRLRVPNLVVRKLYLDRLLRLRLTKPEDRNQAEATVLAFFQDGELKPLLAFVESKLFPALSSRDEETMRELALKALFLSLLFDDRRYSVLSELEVGHGHADLCLLRRRGSTVPEAVNLLFELKHVPRKKTGFSAAELQTLDENQLRAIPQVRSAFEEARAQLGRYRRGFAARFGEAEAGRLRCYVVVAVGIERLMGERLD